MSKKLKWKKTNVTQGYAIQVDKFIRDFPEYSQYVNAHDLSGKGTFILGSEGVECAAKYFDVSMSLHQPGELIDDLRKMGKAGLENHHGSVEGLMSPEFRGSDKFYIALTAHHNKSVIPTATLIHELGHLVEEKIRLDTGEVTSRSYDQARLVLQMNGMADGDEYDLHVLADEWVAWVNSVWIAKMLDIDIRHSILGMVMDETRWQGRHNNTVTRSIARLINFIDTRHAVRHRLATAETVSIRCMLIDEMTSHFFYLESTI